MPPRTHIVGHRGAKALVDHENTLDAFARTAEVGAGWVELDVRRLGDGELVVFHDPAFEGRPLYAMGLAELQERAAKHGFCVPTLDEALAFCAGRVRVDIELKELHTEADAAACARRHLRSDDYVYTSFHDRVIAGLKLLDPAAPAGLLLGRPDPGAPLLTRLTELFPVHRLQACGADFVGPYFRLLRLGFLQRVRAAGYPVWVWTVNDEACMRRLLDAGVDAIITDRPDVGVGLLEEKQPKTPPVDAFEPFEDELVEQLAV